MKKIISLLLVAVMLVGFAPVAVKAAADDASECIHNYSDSSTFKKDGNGDFVAEKEPETDTEVDNCHYCYCENCKRWILMQCSCADSENDTSCTDHSECDYCHESFKHHTSLSWIDQKTEGNCYWRCYDCGAHSEPEDHYYGVECGEYCVKCGHNRTDAEHHFAPKSDENYHWQECSVCGKKSDTDAQPHYSNIAKNKATCTSKAVCDECGREYGNKLDHVKGNYEHSEFSHWQVCKNCGQRVFQSSPHTFSAWHKSSTKNIVSRECSVCGYAETKAYSDHTVSFEDEEHGNIVPDQTVIDGNCAENPGALVETGWTFLGWYYDQALTREYIFTDAVFDDITLYAKWEKENYNIIYKEKDGTAFKGQHDSGYPTTHTYGEPTYLLDAEEDGYEFDGWYGDSSFSGAEITTLGATAYTSDISLYAKLDGHTYYVCYDANTTDPTLTGEMDDSEHVYGTASALTKNAFERTGYYFSKWTRNKDGSGKSYIDQQKVTDLTTVEYDTVTLYAYWTAEEYAIDYYDEGGKDFSGDASGCPSTHTYGEETQLKNPKKPGYEFDGWFTDKDCTESISSIGKTQITEDIKIYAKWTAKTNYIIFNANGEGVSGKMNNQQFTSGDKITLSKLLYKKNEAEFLGWAESDDGQVVYSDEQADLVFEQDDPVELYAVWGDIYKVKLILNGGKIADGKNVTSYTNKVGKTLPTAADVTKDGYSFIGWYEKSDFSDTPVTAIPASETGDKTYYAKWGPKTYSVSFYLVSSSSSSTGTASVSIDGAASESITTSGIFKKELNGGEVIKVTATPGSSYYAKIYTDKKTLATSSKGTAVTYEIPADILKSNPTIKIAFSTNPYTGDDFDPMLWVIAMASAGAGAAITIAKKKSHN